MKTKFDIFLEKSKTLIYRYRYICFALFIMSLLIFLYNKLNINENDKILNEYLQKKEVSQEKGINEKITVYITGSVNVPGVYQIDKDCRINDIINLAGGLTDNANIKNINLAKKLSDGEKVYIYMEGEETVESKENIDNIVNGKININEAEISELETLPGIGNATAYKIKEYIMLNGKFKNIEDIKKVSGIGEGKFEKIKNLICI